MQTKFLELNEDKNCEIKWCAIHPYEKIIAFIINKESFELVIYTYENLFKDNKNLNDDKEDPFKIEKRIVSIVFENLNMIYWSYSGNILYCIKDNSVKWYNYDSKNKKLNFNCINLEDHEILSFCCSSIMDEYCWGTMERVLNIYSQTQEKKEIKLTNKIISLKYDSLGRYLAILTLSNKCSWLNLNNFEMEYNIDISLNPNAFNKLSVKKEERQIDFSPDLNFLIIPSLDDNDIPFACCLERKNSFEIKRIYYGYKSPIVYIKFFPNIFRVNDIILTYFIICDIHMNITLWSTNNEYPLFLIKSEDIDSKVDNIEISEDCKFIFITCSNKYVFVVYFNNINTDFGQMIKRKDYLHLNYQGFSYQNMEIKSFKEEFKSKGINTNIEKNIINKINIKKKEIDINKNKINKEVKEAKEVKKVKEDKEVKEVKKIKDTKEVKEIIVNDIHNKEKIIEKCFKKSKSTVKDSIKYEKYPKEDCKISYIFGDKIIKIKKEVIQKLSNIEHNNIYWNISLVSLVDINNIKYWDILIEEKIEFLKYNEFFIVFYTENSNLYFYDIKNGKPIELPLVEKNLILISININNIFGMINNEGKLTIIDLKNFKNNYSNSIDNIYKIYNPDWEKQITQKNKSIEIDICFFINNEGYPIVGFRNEKFYIYNKEFSNWFFIKQEFFDFNIIDSINQYIYNPNSEIFLKLKYTEIENQLDNELNELDFDKLNKSNQDFDKDLNQYKDLMILSQLENSLIFSMKYQTLKEFSSNLKCYIIELISQNKIKTLQNFILDNILGNQFSLESEYLSKNKIYPYKLVENILIILKEYPQCNELCQTLNEYLKVIKANN